MHCVHPGNLLQLLERNLYVVIGQMHPDLVHGSRNPFTLNITHRRTLLKRLHTYTPLAAK